MCQATDAWTRSLNKESPHTVPEMAMHSYNLFSKGDGQEVAFGRTLSEHAEEGVGHRFRICNDEWAGREGRCRVAERGLGACAGCWESKTLYNEIYMSRKIKYRSMCNIHFIYR